jgi:hypothetical protein
MRYAVAVMAPVELEAEADRVMASLYPEEPVTSGFLARRLSASGEEPATHVGTHVWALEGWQMDVLREQEVIQLVELAGESALAEWQEACLGWGLVPIPVDDPD